MLESDMRNPCCSLSLWLGLLLFPVEGGELGENEDDLLDIINLHVQQLTDNNVDQDKATNTKENVDTGTIVGIRDEDLAVNDNPNQGKYDFD